MHDKIYDDIVLKLFIVYNLIWQNVLLIENSITLGLYCELMM